MCQRGPREAQWVMPTAGHYLLQSLQNHKQLFKKKKKGPQISFRWSSANAWWLAEPPPPHLFMLGTWLLQGLRCDDCLRERVLYSQGLLRCAWWCRGWPDTAAQTQPWGPYKTQPAHLYHYRSNSSSLHAPLVISHDGVTLSPRCQG